MIQVKLLAPLAGIVGAEGISHRSEDVKIPYVEGITVQAVRKELLARYPGLTAMIEDDGILFVLNQKAYIPWPEDMPLEDGSRIQLMPVYRGG